VEWLAQGDRGRTHYQRACSLWVKYAGRRQGSVDFDVRLRHVEAGELETKPLGNEQGAESKAKHLGYTQGVESKAKPKVWGEVCARACVCVCVSQLPLPHSFPHGKLSSHWTGVLILANSAV
jgi:hypothetical protein